PLGGGRGVQNLEETFGGRAPLNRGSQRARQRSQGRVHEQGSGEEGKEFGGEPRLNKDALGAGVNRQREAGNAQEFQDRSESSPNGQGPAHPGKVLGLQRVVARQSLVLRAERLNNRKKVKLLGNQRGELTQ